MAKVIEDRIQVTMGEMPPSRLAGHQRLRCCHLCHTWLEVRYLTRPLLKCLTPRSYRSLSFLLTDLKQDLRLGLCIDQGRRDHSSRLSSQVYQSEQSNPKHREIRHHRKVVADVKCLKCGRAAGPLASIRAARRPYVWELVLCHSLANG
jgi:hypothetical protein